MNEPKPADAKALALTYGYTALIKTLNEVGAIDMDRLFSNLAGAQAAARRVGEVDAADLLGSLAESLQGIG
ncbi:hypothetical protein MBSD_n1603 [Mizugakiibacter sediminis]|uniref:Uncharacterized protein n=1 Tax=Mizugakiibacter sediminis TaxID=1475481 RepID=A0A0K8QN45_9GAMM|nr:hypothetical protein [Mizugakiibacter sediminis]GAP66299.1 hypothetical protein MBSD_n1603 [Mizugakiibacter sediminis]